MKLELKKIRTDGRTQSREVLNEDVIAEYAEAMRRGDKFPMVDVFYGGTDYWFADGFHRANAARRANLKKIEAKIHRETLRDAILFSCGVNAQHGQRRMNADKRRAVLKLLNDQEWRKWSNSEVAKKCAITEGFVLNEWEVHARLAHLVPRELRYGFHVNAVHHSRKVCLASALRCDQCILNPFCTWPAKIRRGREHDCSGSSQTFQLS